MDKHTGCMLTSKYIKGQFIESDEIRLYCEISDSPGANKPVIIYLHGITSNHTEFNHQRRFLEDCSLDSIAYDQRLDGLSRPASAEHPEYYKELYDMAAGDNKSKIPKILSNTPYNLEALTSDLERVLRAASAKKVSVVGHSLGAMVAQSYAAKHPEEVEALALISGSTNFQKSFERGMIRKIILSYAQPLVRRFMAYINERSRYPDKEEYYPDFSGPDFQRGLLLPMLEGTVLGKELYFVLENLTKNTAENNKLMEIISKLMLEPKPWDTSDLIGKILAPTLIIQGDSDNLVPVKTAYELYDSLPQGIRVGRGPVIIRNSGHGLIFQNPAAVNEVLGNFLVGEIYSDRIQKVNYLA
jgi:pimeloyl-ACP methyl ester carboxylesterase